MATIVTGEQYRELDGQLHEIKRQLRQKKGYPYDPEHLKLALQAAIDGRFGAPTNSLLELLGTVAVPKTEKFVARDCFVVNTKAAAPVKISYLGENFRSLFLGKIEAPSGEASLRYHILRQASVDVPIIAELGGEAKAETTLAKIYALMKEQKNGEEGTLLNNGYANIFYVRDVGSVLRTVYVFWNGVGWRVLANSVEDPHGWRGGFRVFSRNS